MQINSIAAAGIASAVWTNATRNLTGPGTGGGAVAQRQVSIAQNAIADLRPSSGLFRRITVVAQSALANLVPCYYDGTNTDAGANASTSEPILTAYGSNTAGLAIKNTNASANIIDYMGWDAVT